MTALSSANIDSLSTDRRSLDPPSVTQLPNCRLAPLMAEHRPSVERLARSIVRDVSLADDVTQETFIAVWQSLDRYRGEGSLRSWILRIAHNQAVSALRARRDQATEPARLPERPALVGTAQLVESRFAADAFMASLASLDHLSQSIVVLREIDGMTYDEVAATIDVPLSTVKTRLLRARRVLGTQLEGWRVDSRSGADVPLVAPLHAPSFQRA